MPVAVHGADEMRKAISVPFSSSVCCVATCNCVGYQESEDATANGACEFARVRVSVVDAR